MCLVLRLEEVLPRPAAGLLHRMLRLAPVDVEQQGSQAEPALLVHADTGYQLSVAAYQVGHRFHGGRDPVPQPQTKSNKPSTPDQAMKGELMLSKEQDQNLRQTICQAFQGCVRAHNGGLAAYQASCLRLSPTPMKVAL